MSVVLGYVRLPTAVRDRYWGRFPHHRDGGTGARIWWSPASVVCPTTNVMFVFQLAKMGAPNWLLACPSCHPRVTDLESLEVVPNAIAILEVKCPIVTQYSHHESNAMLLPPIFSRQLIQRSTGNCWTSRWLSRAICRRRQAAHQQSVSLFGLSQRTKEDHNLKSIITQWLRVANRTTCYWLWYDFKFPTRG